MTPRDVLLLSTSTVHGKKFLEYCIDEVKTHFKGLDRILFIPYARPSGMSYDDYTSLVRSSLAPINIKVDGIHELNDIKGDISQYKGIYIGGGNTFLLLKTLYENDLVSLIRDLVLNRGVKYMGSSAGTNVACKAINNTNDMPIVHTPTLDAIALIPFNINAHYLDPDPGSKHMGETRETRINEFHFHSDIPVLGLREGNYLKIQGDHIQLGGLPSARLFEPGKKAREVGISDDLSFLLKAQ